MTRREWLEGLAAVLPMPAVTVERDGTVGHANPALHALVGLAQGALQGREFAGLLAPEGAQSFRAALQAGLEGSLPEQIETAVPVPGGPARIVRWHQLPLLDPHGRLGAIFSLGVDLTAHVRSEERLASLNRLLAAVRHISATALRVHDPHHLLTVACEALVSDGGCVAAWIIPIGADGRAVGVFPWAPERCTDHLLEALTSESPPLCIAQALAAPGEVHIHAGGCRCDPCPFDRPDPPGCTVVAAVTHDDVVSAVLVALSPLEELGEEHRRLFAALADDLGFLLATLESRALHARTARALQEQQRILEAFFESSLGHAAILDRDLNFVRVNQAYADAEGLEPSEFVGRRHFDLYPDEETRRIFEQVRDSGQPFAVRARPYRYAHHPERGVTWWDWTLTPLFGDDGEVALLSFWSRDVTDEQRARQELEAQRDRLSETTRTLDAFFDHSLDLAAILDRDFNFVRVNRAYADAGGRAPEEFVGHNHFELYPHEENQAIFARVRETGEPYSVRAKPFDYPDHPEWGVTYWDWQFAPIIIDGAPELFGLWLRDVTEQVRAQRALEAQRDSLETMVAARTEELQRTGALLQAIIEASPLAIVALDRGGLVTAWNPAAERLTGWSAAEAVGEPSKLVAPESATESTGLLRRMVAGEVLRDTELLRMHRDGHLLELSMSAAPMKDAAGETVGIVGIFDDVSERKRAERELRETGALLNAIVQASPLAIAVHNSDGLITLWNPAAEVLSGFSAAEAVGRPSPIVPPEKLDDYRRNRATLASGGEIRNLVVERRRRDGSTMLVELNGAPLRGIGGSPAGTVTIFGDVTAREQMAAQLEAYAERLQAMVDEATAELQSSREQLRRQHAFVEAVIEEAAVLVIVVTPDGFIVRFNAACEQISGYPAEEAVGRSFIELLIPLEDRERTRAELERAVASELVEYENWWLTKLGELRRITWRFANLHDETGATAFIVATGLDVTEQRRVEQALAESEELYRQLVQSANSIIVRWDADGTIRFMNDYGLAFFGYAREELIGQSVTALVPETDSYGNDLSALVEDIVERPQDYWVNENENITRDGHRVWVSWSNRAIRDEAGRLAGIMAVGVDRTLQREMDLELRRSRESLRMLAARLAAAERRERQEIAGMLHDNLGQLLAFAKMALSASADSADEGQAARLRTVRQYLDEAISYTRSLTTQLSPPVLSQLGFGAALQWLGDDLEQRHHVAIRVESEELAEIDQEIAIMLFSAVREALYNVIKHARADEVTVRATSKGTHVLIEVEDNGVGFDLTDLDVGVGREGGFGLFNVREQLSYLGGHLEIESEPGRGTRVALLCPPTAERKRTPP